MAEITETKKNTRVKKQGWKKPRANAQRAGKNKDSAKQAASQPAKNEKTVAPKKKAAPKQRTQKKRKPQPKPSVRVFSLGGLNEIGKNITVIESGNDIIVVDCGIGFTDDDMLGVDLVIPDFTYLINNVDKIRGVFGGESQSQCP